MRPKIVNNLTGLYTAEVMRAERCPDSVRHHAQAVEGGEDFYIDSVRRQLALYQGLGVLADNTQAVLAELDRLEQEAGIRAAPGQTVEPPRILLFTGHRIDAPGRAEPRFPAAKEPEARAAIKDAVAKEQARISGELTGMAGGASGGDILFHEVCAELGIPTELHLALPRDAYVKESVAPAGPDWVERFDRLLARLPHRELASTPELPRWLRERPGYGIWQRNNRWLLHQALARGRGRMTLMALWDRSPGDGPGGTEDMVRTAEARGARVVILDTRTLFADR